MHVSSLLNRQWMMTDARLHATAGLGTRSAIASARRLLVLSPTALGMCVGMLTAALTACSGGDIVQLPAAPDAERIWSVRLDARAVALAKGETYQLSATPLNARNEPVADAPPIRFRSLNLDCVRVDSTGTLTALLPTVSAPVVAELTLNGVTFIDTVAVYVTETAHVAKSIALRNFSDQPIATTIILGDYLSFNPVVLDDSGKPISGIIPKVVSSDSRILTAAAMYASAQDIGRAKLRTSIVAYGQRLTDSTEITVQIPTNLSVFLSGPPKGTYFVATGGTIRWSNYWYLNLPINITFDSDSPAIVGGNIEQIASNASVSRTFTAPGTYHFRDTLNGSSGAVLVRDQPVYDNPL